MACGQSMAHARLMGAISHKRGSQFVFHEPSRASCSGGFFFSPQQDSFELSGASRNGRPGSRDSRGNARVRCAGPAGGNGATRRPPIAGRTTRVRFGGAQIGESAATQFVSQFAIAARCGCQFQVVKKPDPSSHKRRSQDQSGFACSPGNFLPAFAGS